MLESNFLFAHPVYRKSRKNCCRILDTLKSMIKIISKAKGFAAIGIVS
jgi:hypothetical protein